MLRVLVAGITSVLAAGAAGLGPGWNEIQLRGVSQDVLTITGRQPKQRASVLFLPGDGGWRGVAKDIAEAIAGAGYDVFVWDTKRYLTSFTHGRSTLAVNQIGPDFAEMRRAVANTGERVALLGWSQGAAMSVVAAASPEGKQAFAGVIALALPDCGVLGWRWRDNLTWLTGGTPNEPEFRTEQFLPLVAPLPVSVIQAGRDKFTTKEVSRRLFSHLKHPRRVRTLEDAEHDFGPERASLFVQLRKSLHWISNQPSIPSGVERYASEHCSR